MPTTDQLKQTLAILKFLHSQTSSSTYCGFDADKVSGALAFLNGQIAYIEDQTNASETQQPTTEVQS